MNIKTITLTSAVTLLLGGGLYAHNAYADNNYTLDVDGIQTQVTSKSTNTKNILQDNNIVLSKHDRVSSDSVSSGETIIVNKAKPIKIKDGDTIYHRFTTYEQANDIAKENNINIGIYDRMEIIKDQGETTLSITRITKETKSKKEEINYSTKEETDKESTETKTKQDGEKGEKEVLEEIVYENGKQIGSKKLHETVTKKPKDKIIVKGTKQKQSEPKQNNTPSIDPKTEGGSIRLSNGNTAGAVGAEAAQEMARRTGVPASTWETIIARESNGRLDAYNPSGARGLFQTMPGWGSTATLQDQINAATKAYNAQGLSAWGM